MRNRSNKASVLEGENMQSIMDLKSQVANMEDKLVGMEKLLIQLVS